MVLDNRSLRRIKILTFHELSSKRRSFLTVIRLQTDEITHLLLQRVNSQNFVTVPKKAASFNYLELHRDTKEMKSDILRRIKV